MCQSYDCIERGEGLNLTLFGYYFITNNYSYDAFHEALIL